MYENFTFSLKIGQMKYEQTKKENKNRKYSFLRKH